MAEILDFELGSSRLCVKRAEKSLKRAKEETDRKNGVVKPRQPARCWSRKGTGRSSSASTHFFLEV
ncbi:hypothetical protein EN904_15470 [Mesorhizobium sp. M7A.F.Ca.CA.001.07.2.1]|uniref:hypothetical protein n=1 Tax=Mesorhizobium TaxID=68287 RepID=UPI000FCBDCE9|nr:MULTISPECIES: hypothetical protein [Mesorhizobium]RVA98382.1 hypothetical protein EN910_06755 [Mesorhizobium sp. M7A.F.Ca.CA.004.01.1.1]RVB31262.1 hypothetical protein EN918_20255 [Mesorhizobium sp. M7A.F.Ca.CA.004.05.1.1]MCF6125741.1 hypothetical protein [Mesorhizobium ciceri]MCQ8817925.1 hypothetical protein [Mesorhizobium sp. SEMIA396]RUX71108.1 hypothetical protein EN983_24100 [Mesorhizobium sp. M7A.F.Ca.CA.004.08.2.1]